MPSECDKLMRTLFNNPDRELIDIKFFRPDGAKSVREKDFCARVNKIIFEIDTGLAETHDRFPEDSDKTVDIKELVKRFA